MKPIESSLPGATSTATSAPALAVSATSTASSTSPEIPPVPYATISGRFEDRIVKNKDVREFRAADGKIVFLYSFIDQTKLVVTASEETLAEIISRLERQAFIR
jgi:hypothetical protein